MSETVKQRINNYLVNGGLFNPKLANHDAVHDLLLDCRDEIDSIAKATAARCVEICYDQSHDDTKRGRLQAQSVLTRCAATIKKEYGLE